MSFLFHQWTLWLTVVVLCINGLYLRSLDIHNYDNVNSSALTENSLSDNIVAYLCLLSPLLINIVTLNMQTIVRFVFCTV